jgi:hypothetical protein
MQICIPSPTRRYSRTKLQLCTNIIPYTIIYIPFGPKKKQNYHLEESLRARYSYPSASTLPSSTSTLPKIGTASQTIPTRKKNPYLIFPVVSAINPTTNGPMNDDDYNKVKYGTLSTTEKHTLSVMENNPYHLASSPLGISSA